MKRIQVLILVMLVFGLGCLGAFSISYMIMNRQPAEQDSINNSHLGAPIATPEPVPTQEIPVFSKDLVRTATNGSIMDRFPLPGPGTYRVAVKTYQPETEVTVAVDYQELISTDKFGTKIYGGFGTPGGYCYNIDYRGIRGNEIYCTPPLQPGNISIHGVGNINRYHDLDITFNLTKIGILQYPPAPFEIAVYPTDIINPHLEIITTKADKGRITVDVWKIV